MTETLAAILSTFQSNLTPTPFVGGLYYQKIPSTPAGAVPTYPYCVYTDIAGTPIDFAFGNKMQENPVIQFAAFHNSAGNALAAIESVAAVFDTFYNSASIALPAGSRWLSFLRQQEPRTIYEGKDQQGNDVYQGLIRYDLSVQK